MRRAVGALIILAVLAGGAGWGAGWFLSAPRTLAESDLPAHDGDPAKGRVLFHVGGCASCHAAPKGAEDAQDATNGETAEAPRLAGGRRLKTPFGTFVAPNISPDPEHGIGAWRRIDFVNAMVRGVAPDGSHYYPAFPYLSYQRMRVADVLDLKAFMDGLPAVARPSEPHDLPLPFRVRRGVGLWKQLYMDYRPFTPIDGASAQENRGAYLVEGPGHCGECHTPRTVLGGPIAARAYAGGPAPEGEGTIPNITSHPDGIGDWSVADLKTAFRTGLLPEFESFGGSMVDVQENLAELSEADREAIAVYLKSLPPRPDAPSE